MTKEKKSKYVFLADWGIKRELLRPNYTPDELKTFIQWAKRTFGTRYIIRYRKGQYKIDENNVSDAYKAWLNQQDKVKKLRVNAALSMACDNKALSLYGQYLIEQGVAREAINKTILRKNIQQDYALLLLVNYFRNQLKIPTLEYKGITNIDMEALKANINTFLNNLTDDEKQIKRR